MIPLNKTLMRLRIPGRVLELPRDARGFPIPFFVYRDKDGVADFRVIHPGRIEDAVNKNLCWICGGELARHKSFVIGPLASINRVSPEPPSHRGCAMFAAQGCPFLTQPRMRRNEIELPEEKADAPGIMLQHNPGVVAVWIAHGFSFMPVHNGMLFTIGEPTEVRWLTMGRPASRGEVIRAIEKGLPKLFDIAREDGPEATDALVRQIEKARAYLPPPDDDDRPLSSGDAKPPGAPRPAASAAS